MSIIFNAADHSYKSLGSDDNINWVSVTTLISHFKKDEKLIIFDIGSCDGLDSIKYTRMFPSASIYAFEPLSKNVELIHSNINTYGVSSIQVVPIALSDKKGQEKFYVSSGNPEELKSTIIKQSKTDEAFKKFYEDGNRIKRDKNDYSDYVQIAGNKTIALGNLFIEIENVLGKKDFDK